MSWLATFRANLSRGRTLARLVLTDVALTSCSLEDAAASVREGHQVAPWFWAMWVAPWLAWAQLAGNGGIALGIALWLVVVAWAIGLIIRMGATGL